MLTHFPPAVPETVSSGSRIWTAISCACSTTLIGMSAERRL